MIYAVLQIAVIGLIVAFSAVQVFRKLLPGTAAAVQAHMANALLRFGLTGLSERLKSKTAPSGGGCGSDSGCGTCNACGTIARMTEGLPKR